MWTIPPLEELEETLRDPSSPIGKRMRAAYFAKQLFVNESSSSPPSNEKDELCNRIVNVLCEQVFVKDHGSLLRHEFAYVLGQMQTPKACQTLEELLMKDDDCVMVRHEAAEALGAIASLSSKQVLESTRDRYKGTLDELADTCSLALNRLTQQELQDSIVVGCACMLAPFNSVDPAAPDAAHVTLSTAELGDILLNEDGTHDLIERYRAMFSLRNRGGEEAVLQLCRALVNDQSSPLLRHEVAFVLGQLQHPSSISALEESLSRQEEHTMVRHESAEALGAIEGGSEDWNRIENILTKYQKDNDQAVAESCIVALDAADYFGSNVIASQEDSDTPSSNEETDNHSTPNSFGQQKHASDIRKHILDEHFNVHRANE
jgi:deoxyhypusine monooxygenase